jgi:hypothetical protein
MVEMATLNEMVKLSVVVGVQSAMNGSAWWLSVHRDIGQETCVHTWRCDLCQVLHFRVSRWLRTSLVCSSCISSQCFRFVPCCFPACSLRLGISCLALQFSVVNFLPIPAIVVVSLVLRLIKSEGRTAGSFGVVWVELSQ